MQQKFFKRVIGSTLLMGLLITTALAVDALIPVGRTVGVKMHASGVIVASIESVHTSQGETQPAMQAGMKVGDIILSIDGKNTTDNDQLQKAIALSAGQPLQITVLRGEQQVQLTAQAIQDTSGTYKMGLLIRDGIAGIGTVTYVDPETGNYGALGHGICDMETGALIPMQAGSLMESSVVNVQRGEIGAPGALQGEFNLQHDMGTVQKNTEVGIFGRLTENAYYDHLEPMPLATLAEVQTGACEILSNVAGEQVQAYDAEIIKVFQAGDPMEGSLMLHVTDPQLLAQTGGIVQGMSGSPIIQNDKFIGAVTHVFVNDPTKGYGVFIENMLEMAEDVEK